MMAPFQLPTKSKVCDTPIRRVPSRPDKSSPRLPFPQRALPVEIFQEGKSPAQFYSSYNRSLGQSYISQCYRNLSLLGEGSYGKVYKAYSKLDNKWYAIKKFKTPYRNLSDRRNRLKEVQQYGKVPQNQNCVKLKSAWEEAGQLYLQMELCSLSLDQYIRHNKIEEDEMWKILHDILSGLKNIHDCEFIHLDIKPENILVTDDKVFKLGDFGLLLDLSQGPVKDGDEGDAKYLAAEVLNGMYTKAADIFSLGISMLEIGANVELPTSGEDWHHLREGVLPRFQMSHLSEDLFQVIASMMLPTHTDRPTIEQLLQHERLREIELSRYVRIVTGMKKVLKSWYRYGTSIAMNILRPVLPFLPFTIVQRFQPCNNEIGAASANSATLENSQNMTPIQSIREISVLNPPCKRRIFGDDDTVLHTQESSDNGNSSQDKVTDDEKRKADIKVRLIRNGQFFAEKRLHEGAGRSQDEKTNIKEQLETPKEQLETRKEQLEMPKEQLDTAKEASSKRIKLASSTKSSRSVRASTLKKRVSSKRIKW